MIKVLRPLLRGSTYSGVLFAVLGALAGLPLALVALVPVAGMQASAYAVPEVLSLALWVVLIGAVGLAGATRRVLVRGARRLLGVVLPDPVKGTAGERWRTPAFLVLHVVSGWLVLFGGSVLLTMGVFLPTRYAEGDARLSLFGWSEELTAGWRGVVAAVCLVAAVVLFAAVSGVLRWLAPRLLGPSATERLAVAAERERVLAERNRLAQELHDSIGHTLTAATIQAAVAGEVLAADPTAARAAMRSIEESTRAALEDLDYVLGVLREEDAGTAPTRTLADLPELLDRLRHAGAVVETEILGDPARVQGAQSRAAYRILQEGLTNALRHGAGGPIELRVVVADDGLELGVVNGIKPGPSGFPTSGHGLTGLAERVRLLHGEFEAGLQGAHGEPQHWRLAVRLPVRLSA